MASKKPKPDFELYFSSGRIYPESIPVRSIADAIASVHTLTSDSGEEEDGESIPLRLLGVKRGSAVFQCVAADSDSFMRKIRQVGRCIEHVELSDDLDGIANKLNAIRRLSAIAKSLDCPIVIRKPGDKTDILAKILPASYDLIAESLLVDGEKMISGRVERIGGATATKCALRVEFQTRLLICAVKKREVLVELARNLYQDVVVCGVATWLRRTWQIISFDIDRVEKTQKGPLVEAIEALRCAGADAWDRVDDVDVFLDEVSGKG